MYVCMYVCIYIYVRDAPRLMMMVSISLSESAAGALVMTCHRSYGDTLALWANPTFYTLDCRHHRESPMSR